MSIKTYFILTTISSLIFGMAFICAPSFLAELHGYDLSDNYSTLIMRVYGGALISIGLMAWVVKDSKASVARKGILFFLALFDAFNTLLNGIFIAQHGGAMISYLELIVTITFGALALHFWRKE